MTRASFGPLQVQISCHHLSPLQRLPWLEFLQGLHLDFLRVTPQGRGTQIVSNQLHPRFVMLQVSPLRGPTRVQAPLESNGNSNKPLFELRNIPTESPSCNLAFWPASQSTYSPLLLTYTSHLICTAVSSPHLILLSSHPPSSSCH